MTASRTEPRRLVLVRHAKAVGSSGGGDRARPLTDKGRADADALGGWLAARLAMVDVLWSSSAVRARQTTTALRAGLPAAPDPVWRDDLYDAGPGDVLALLRDLPDETGAIVLVGHNPTIEAVHAALTGEPRGFRPGAAAIIELEQRWSSVGESTGQLVDFCAL
ncbi:MAG: phosphohistidine phosphatase [Actinomycetota bacterium]|jgi:phosphohistidine phosphatase|nr:phosphohistidine phosphatase [Actinomycetota bacterium]